MGRKAKIYSGTLLFLAIGYLVGAATSRNRKKSSKFSGSASELEKQLKQIFSQYQEILAKINSSTKLKSKMNKSKATLLKNQEKIKQLLSAIHGNDAIDDDLAQAIIEAKKGLKSFANYLNK